MKRFLLFFGIIFWSIALSACGVTSGDETGENRELYDILVNSSEIIGVEEGGEEDRKLLGMQFYRGEPVQIWAEQLEAGDGKVWAALFLRGQEEKEVLLPRLETERDFFPATGLLDEAGSFYGIKNDRIVKYGSEGEEIYSVKAEGWVQDACAVREGQLALLVNNAKKSCPELVLMDSSTGRCQKLELSEDLYSVSFVGNGGDGLYVLDRDGLWEIDEKEKTRSKAISFLQTSYAFKASVIGLETMEAFRVTENGDVELLWADAQGRGRTEKLEAANIREDKTAVTLRGIRFLDTWLKERVVEFNRVSEKYYVVIQSCEDLDLVEDYITQTGVELATGKGPDILYKTDILGDAAYSLIQKGTAADLKPFLERSGIREEDYFPAAFDCLRQGEGIYGVNVRLSATGYAMKESVAGDGRDLNAEAVLDALLAYDGKAVYRRGVSSGEMLREFLESSESLWGMVDRREEECDFGGELFGKLLEAAKRYGDDGRNSYEQLSERRNCGIIYLFDSDGKLSERGLVPSGALFDDGRHGITDDNFIFLIHANSPNQEGAWEFLKFLLSEEVQSIIDYKSLPPVHRGAFDRFMEREIAEGAEIVTKKANGSVHVTRKGPEDLTEEQAAEIKAFLEDARPLPIRNQPILDIVCEEAQDYFQGVKSAEEVIRVIENRVGLYLKENR